jgi:hypothetical protein
MGERRNLSSLDHLFIEQSAVPTLVEVRRSDTMIRREVVGQMLDYAANGVAYWPSEVLRADFEARYAREGKDAAEVFRDGPVTMSSRNSSGGTPAAKRLGTDRTGETERYHDVCH